MEHADALRDIHGLDSVSWLPLAPGWWYLLGLVLALLLLAGIRYWLIYNGPWLGWRGDARRQLRVLNRITSYNVCYTKLLRDFYSRDSNFLYR